MDKVKFGLIGCGRISAKHFEAIAQIEDAEIIACADIIKARALEAAEKYKVKSVYKDYTKMLKSEVCGYYLYTKRTASTYRY
ncbi:MAG: hypothetical protein B1H06_00140 [Candidatus Cloacimonas sp. 4484_143]|nr:MAG: hypothetical protein B1H06_00140 [Candidatus Cloacimonas sp. 4484_143]